MANLTVSRDGLTDRSTLRLLNSAVSTTGHRLCNME
jgi:hypothetical protein